MAYLKISGGDTVTTYVNFVKKQSLTNTVQTALDGTVYMTRFGSAVYTYSLEVYVDTAGRNALFDAYDNLTLLEIKVKEGTFTGRIQTMKEFKEEYSGWFSSTLELAAVSEVSTR